MYQEQELTFNDLPQVVAQLCNKIENLETLLIEKSEAQPPQEQDKLLTIKEAAKFLNLTVSTMYTKVSKQELPVMKMQSGKRLYFSQKELTDYLKVGRRKSAVDIKAEAENYLKANTRQ